VLHSSFLPKTLIKKGKLATSQRGLDDEIKRHNYVVFEGKKKKKSVFLKNFMFVAKMAIVRRKQCVFLVRNFAKIRK
jgi:hypothetical protein